MTATHGADAAGARPQVGWNPVDLFNQAARRVARGRGLPRAGAVRFDNPIDTVSLGLGARARHRRPAAHPDALLHRARRARPRAASVVWAMVLIGAFYLMTTALGFGARAILGEGGRGGRRHGRQPRRADPRRGARRRRRHHRRRPVPGRHRRGRVRDDPRGRRRPGDLRVGRGRPRRLVERRPQGPRLRGRGGRRGADRRVRHRRDRDRASRSSAATGLNVSFMVGLAFAVAASANFPALLLALTWRRFNTTGAVTGVLVGVVSSIGLDHHQPDGVAGRGLRGLAVRPGPRQPGDHLDPAGLPGLLARHRAEPARAARRRRFHELYVRSETGLGAEEAGT